MDFLKKAGRTGLFLLTLLVLCVPALAAGVTEDGAPPDWTEAEERDGVDYYGTAPAARAALTRLDAPAELEWGVDYHQFGEKGTRTEIPGVFSWRLGTLRQYRYKVCVYRKDGSGDQLVDVTERWYGGDRGGNVEMPDGSRRSSCFRFLLEDRESGDYYFTVQALGDGNGYESSPAARSGVWHYEKAAERLGTPGRPAYDGKQFSWSVPDCGSAMGRHARFYFSAEKDGEPVEAGNGSVVTRPPDETETAGLPDLALEECGSGWYSVRVRTISRDLGALDSSAWSERSEPVYLESNSARLEELLEGLTESSSAQDRQAAVDAVRQMDAYALSQLMAADTENTGAAGSIARLEELAGTRASVDVSGRVKEDLDPSRISIVGAGLNVDVGQTVALKVGEPDPGAILPTMYGNALQFSMGLEKGEGTALGGRLAVPVKITLPLPGYVNPDHLVILHRRADGSYEEVFEPYVRKENGQWLASFMVRSFSTFALAERRLSASQIPTGAEASLLPENRDGASACFCALYDGEGRLLGVRGLDLSGKRQTVRFACETSAPDHGKLLYLDAGSRPVGEAETFTVTKG